MNIEKNGNRAFLGFSRSERKQTKYLKIELCKNIFFTISAERLTKRLRLLTFEHLMKQEVAFFDDENNVAIHNLTCASLEIFDALCKKNNLSRAAIYQGLELVRPELRKKVIDKISEAKNYFKHGGSDPNESFSCNRPCWTGYKE